MFIQSQNMLTKFKKENVGHCIDKNVDVFLISVTVDRYYVL